MAELSLPQLVAFGEQLAALFEIGVVCILPRPTICPGRAV